MIPLLADESIHGAIVQGLRRRHPPIDLITVIEAGLRGEPDPNLLEWAAAQNRIIVSSDAATMIGDAYERVRAQLPMPGLIVTRQSLAIGQVVEDLLTIYECVEPGEYEGRVIHLPL